MKKKVHSYYHSTHLAEGKSQKNIVKDILRPEKLINNVRYGCDAKKAGTF